ncbi:hypothetical protein [Burkholderia ubonensis]|uniref:hypothetical protein n=1 Tax=Burkholderia ubonensis TaxID=101571 RepID=UPI0012F81AA9|nr:hypothetical protein [Burkholderia ubonensis]
MFYWRSFLLAAVLILSLPLRIAAATPSACCAVPGMAASSMAAPVQRTEFRGPDAVRQTPATVTLKTCCHVGDHARHASHAAGPCGTCASCIACAVAAGPRIAAYGFEITNAHAARPDSDPASTYLTEGIDRPPRIFLA